MSIPGAASPLFIGAAAEEAAFQIDRSLRFNSGDSTYLNRTPSSAGNRKTWTWSGWVKRSALSGSGYPTLFNAGSASTSEGSIRFNPDDTIEFYDYNLGYNARLNTNRVFRDFSAWYHIVAVFDTTNATAAERLRIYINGVEDSGTNIINPSQNLDGFVNNNIAHSVGSFYSTGRHFDGYLAEVHFVDGTALAPTDFGEYDDNNNWNPKAYSGTYGTNGFHLDFSNTSDLGADAAGSNDWTPNNLFGTAPGLATANQGFDVVTYTGNGSTQSITGLNFQPDFIWFKRKNSVSNHAFYDVIRGATKVLGSDSTSAEVTETGGFDSFDANGFSLDGFNSTFGSTNASGGTFVAWCWKAGGTASSNSDGSITSSVSANTTYGFSIVTYTGTGSNATVGHGLSSTPKWIIVKRRDSAGSWIVWHDAFGAASNTDYLYLNSQIAIGGDGANAFWNSTVPTSSLFSVGTGASVNASSATYVAYCWSEISGFSKFGSYTGNNNSTGPVVNVGFKTRWIMIKRANSTGNWIIYDTERDGANDNTKRLYANTSSAEVDNSGYRLDITDTTFQPKSTNDNFNASADYIYAAFAGTPPGEVIDSLIDTPTNYTAGSGNNGGNYATLNPLQNAASDTFSDGNLKVVTNTTNYGTHTSTIATPLSGKWYAEVKIGSASVYSAVGLVAANSTFTTTSWPASLNGVTYYGNNGNKYIDSSASSYGASFGNGDTIGIAYDADNGTVIFYKNGASQGTISSVTVREYLFGASDFDSGSVTYYWNFGQRPFAYTPPTGHVSLCTTNLADPTIADGSTVFDVRSGKTAQFTINDLNFATDLVVAKSTSNDEYWIVADVVRSFIGGLRFNDTNTEGSGNAITSVGATGYQSDSNWFTTGRTYVTYNWDAGTSTATNNDGSVASSVRVNQSAGFSIVKFTGTGSNATVGHNLNSAPELVILKGLTTTFDWIVWHKAIPATSYLSLNSDASVNNNLPTVWNSTAPTASVFSVGSSVGSNTSGAEHIAYCFTPVAGYSAFGSYTGNGSSDGPFIFTGMRPALVLWKRTDAQENWAIIDNSRSPFNVADDWLGPNSTSAESSNNSAYAIDMLSNGFKVRASHAAANASGGTYIWAAFCEHPFKTARAR